MQLPGNQLEWTKKCYSKILEIRYCTKLNNHRQVFYNQCHERYCSSWIMRKMVLVNRLSHDCHIDIDRDVSTAYCRSSSGDSVDLVSRTI